MGVTDLRPHFTHIIGHINSVNVHRIPTKLGTEIRLSPLRVPHFSLIGARIHVLWRILRSVRKEEVEEKEKNQEKNPNFGRSYLGNG